jgi:hypothetical protein
MELLGPVSYLEVTRIGSSRPAKSYQQWRVSGREKDAARRREKARVPNEPGLPKIP